MRALLLSDDYRTARLVDGMLRATWSDIHLVTHPTFDAAAAEALLDHPGCCVLLDATLPARPDAPNAPNANAPDADPLSLLEYVRMSAPDAPIVLLCSDDDEDLTLRAVRQGAQDCLIMPELEPVQLRRALIRAIERKRGESRLAHQALHDPLTGLPNRALFLDRLRRSRSSAPAGPATPLAVLFLDLDSFKVVNDSLGHAAGDALLLDAGRAAARAAAPERHGRALRRRRVHRPAASELADEREAMLIAERIAEAAGAAVELDGRELSSTRQHRHRAGRRPGAATPDDAAPRRRRRDVPRQGAAAAALRALRRAMRARALRAARLETELRRALERGELASTTSRSSLHGTTW